MTGVQTCALPILEAIVVAGNLKKPGTGIIFSVPVTDLIGLHHREEFDD